jgi:hypothetical protein
VESPHNKSPKHVLPSINPVGSRDHCRFTQDDIKLITKIDEYQKQGFVLKVATEKATER